MKYRAICNPPKSILEEQKTKMWDAGWRQERKRVLGIMASILTAIDRAETLKPDLATTDVWLPQINGFDEWFREWVSSSLSNKNGRIPGVKAMAISA